VREHMYIISKVLDLMQTKPVFQRSKKETSNLKTESYVLQGGEDS